MSALKLAGPPDREWLTAFGIALGLASGLVVGVSSYLVGWPPGHAVLVGAGLATLVAALGAWRPARLELPYRLWNRVAGIYARLARGSLVTIWYFTVVLVTRTNGEKLGLRAPARDSTVWKEHETLETSVYASEGRDPRTGHADGSVPGFLSWAARPERLLALSLSPLLLSLRALGSQGRESSGPAEIYTLY